MKEIEHIFEEGEDPSQFLRDWEDYIVKVELEDATECIPGKNFNGGAYSYYTIWEWDIKIQKYELRYASSADFSYCKRFGHFQDCSNCMYFNDDAWSEGIEYCGVDPEYYDIPDIIKEIGGPLKEDHILRVTLVEPEEEEGE